MGSLGRFDGDSSIYHRSFVGAAVVVEVPSCEEPPLGGAHMPVYVLSGLLSVTLAFVFYTWGIWGPRKRKEIKPLHVTFLWLGLVLDAGGTALMAMQIGYYRMDIHGIIGTLAIALMAVSAIWATVVRTKRDPAAVALYIRFSVLVWAFWLLPYFYGFIANRVR